MSKQLCKVQARAIQQQSVLPNKVKHTAHHAVIRCIVTLQQQHAGQAGATPFLPCNRT